MTVTADKAGRIGAALVLLFLGTGTGLMALEEIDKAEPLHERREHLKRLKEENPEAFRKMMERKAEKIEERREKREDWLDRREDIRDRREDKWDRREDRRDKREDRMDRREDRRDGKKDRRNHGLHRGDEMGVRDHGKGVGRGKGQGGAHQSGQGKARSGPKK